MNERRQSPFVGPHNYECIESFNKLNKSPCLAKMMPDEASGNHCINMIGNTRVYVPAFEKPHERRQLIHQTRDLQFKPRAGVVSGLNRTLQTKVSKKRLASKEASEDVTSEQYTEIKSTSAEYVPLNDQAETDKRLALTQG